MATKSPLGAKAPKVAMQGGHGKAPVQPAKIQKKNGPDKPAKSTLVFGFNKGGTKGTNAGAK